MNNLFDEDGHVSVEAIYALKEGSLSDEDMIKVLDHITQCTMCSDMLSESYDESEFVEVPAGFEESTQLKIKSKNRKKIDLAFYSMKVGAAALIAISIVFSSHFNMLISSNGNGIKAPDLSRSEKICSQLNSISERIINLEVLK